MKKIEKQDVGKFGFAPFGNPYPGARIPSRRAKAEPRTDRNEGRQAGLEKTERTIRLCSGLNRRVSVFRLIRPPDSQRWESKKQLSCLLAFISSLELILLRLGVASGLFSAAWRQWTDACLMSFAAWEQSEKKRGCQGCLHSVLCLRCTENGFNPPRKVYFFLSFRVLFLLWMQQSEWKVCNFAAVLKSENR